MADSLTACKIFNETVAKKALICPHCCGRLRMHPFTKFIVIVLGGFGGFILLMIMMYALFIFIKVG